LNEKKKEFIFVLAFYLKHDNLETNPWLLKVIKN